MSTWNDILRPNTEWTAIPKKNNGENFLFQDGQDFLFQDGVNLFVAERLYSFLLINSVDFLLINSTDKLITSTSGGETTDNLWTQISKPL